MKPLTKKHFASADTLATENFNCCHSIEVTETHDPEMKTRYVHFHIRDSHSNMFNEDSLHNLLVDLQASEIIRSTTLVLWVGMDNGQLTVWGVR